MDAADRWGRAAWWAALALGLAAIWAAPHPPMIDLPQHAGQLRLMRDLLLGGGSPWAGLVEFNPWTPYFIAFGLALPLTAVMSIAAALKVVLSLAFVAFAVLACRLRARFGAPAALDVLAPLGFFGFAFKWGFLTFLVAAPLGLAFLLASLWAAERPGSPRRTAALLGLGAALLLSHGLVFLWSLAAGATMALCSVRAWGARWRALAPHGALLAACALYSVLRGQAEARYGIPPTVPAVQWHQGLRHEILYYPFGIHWTPASALAAAGAYLLPWLAGYRLRWRGRVVACVPLAVLALVQLGAPSFALEISYLYQRFGLFLLPAYAWCFAAPAAAPARERWRVPAVQLLSVLALLSLVANVHGAWRFGKEQADFAAMARQLEPGQRALALIHDRDTRAYSTPGFGPYVHYASWYQAEQGGFVEMNFATAPPQVLRMRPDRASPLPLRFAWKPEAFGSAAPHLHLFRYVLVRGGPSGPPAPFDGLECPQGPVASAGTWRAWEPQRCRPR